MPSSTAENATEKIDEGPDQDEDDKDSYDTDGPVLKRGSD